MDQWDTVDGLLNTPAAGGERRAVGAGPVSESGDVDGEEKRSAAAPPGTSGRHSDRRRGQSAGDMHGRWNGGDRGGERRKSGEDGMHIARAVDWICNNARLPMAIREHRMRLRFKRLLTAKALRVARAKALRSYC